MSQQADEGSDVTASPPVGYLEADESLYPSAARAWLTGALLVLAYMLALLDRQILSLMVGPIRASLKINDLQIGLLQGFAFVLLFSICALPLARWADRSNRKRVVVAGVFVWSVMTAACGLARGIGELFVARVGVGVGQAALGPAAYSILSDSFPPKQLVRANAVYNLGALVGSGVALMAGGSVIQYFTLHTRAVAGLKGLAPWQLTFLALGLPGVAFALLLLVLLKEPRRLGVVSAPIPLSEVLGQIWCRRQEYGPFYVSSFLLGIVTYSQFNWLPTHLLRVFKLSVGTVGLTLGLIVSLGAVSGSFVGPALTGFLTRRGARAPYLRTVMIISILIVPAMLGPAMPTANAFLAMVFVFYILQTAFVSPLYTAIQVITPNRMRGVAVALGQLIGNLGGLGVGVALVGAIADNLFPGKPHGVGEAMMMVGMSSGALAAVTAAYALARNRRNPDALIV